MSSLARASLFGALAVGLAAAIFLIARSTPRSPRSAAPDASRPQATLPIPDMAPEPDKSAAAALVMPAPPSSTPVLGEAPTEDSLAAAVHALEDSDPERALELARRGRARWPAGLRAPEFAAVEVKCLYRLGKPSEGRGAAEAMVNQYPTSPWALEVERQTGAHPYVNH